MRHTNVARDILSEGFPKYIASLSIRQSERDKIIADILDHDQMQMEYIKRLILEDTRVDVLMRILGLNVSPHHMAFISFIEGLRAKGVRSGVVLAPRGSGKSTCNNICYTIVRVLQNRDLAVLEASKTAEQAKSFLSAIKENLVKPQVIEMFGETKGEVWGETKASIFGRSGGTKEQTFHIAGADGAVVSKHFDLIQADDLVDEKNSQSEITRFQVQKFFYKSLLPCLKPDGEIWGNGTRYHPEDLYGRWLKDDTMFNKSYFILPGVFDVESGEAVDLEENEKGDFYVPEGAQVWDPVGFPEKQVLERRGSMPQGDFEAQYQNRIEYLKGDYFDIDEFKYYNEDPMQMVIDKALHVYVGVDLAISQNETADEFALVVTGIKPKLFEIYVLEYLSGRYTFNKQKELVTWAFDRWDPIRTCIESNAYQAALEMSVAEEFPDVRTMKVYTTKDKISRAKAFSVYYERGQVYHREKRSSKLEGQLTGFPHVKLKDLFDAFYISVWGALYGLRKERRKGRKFGVIGGRR